MMLNPHLVPPNGYVFTDSDGVAHRGQSWPHLVRVVAQYRALTKKPPGDPGREITQAVCMASPQLCQNSGHNTLADKDRDRFYIKVSDWLNRMARRVRDKMQPHVGPTTARERADVCRGCPFQVQWQKNCASCLDSNKVQRKAVLDGRPDVAPELLGCQILGEDTRVSVHLDVSTVAEARLPAKCWRRKR